MVPGTYNAKTKKCFIAYKGESFTVADFEVLHNADNYGWKSVTHNEVPANAIQANVEGEKLFIGRVSHHGEFHVGAVDSKKKFFVSINGKVEQKEKFEILVEKYSGGEKN